MKKAFALFGLAAGLSVSAMAADVTGYIIDEMCSKMPAMKGDVACANKCIKAGSPAVLVTDDGKIYKIAEQAKVIPNAGKKVTLTGKVDGETIHVDKVKSL
jgi:Protein of unknown function (DUF5818)